MNFPKGSFSAMIKNFRSIAYVLKTGNAMGKSLPRKEPKTHDYTDPIWGKNYTIIAIHNEGQELRVCGWGFGIEAGDYILFETEGGTTRYQVKAIEYKVDPKDMWAAVLTFAPRVHNE